ncbi:MAG: ComEC/Rec2 family competence protein [Synergistaceae bacterium]|nr:ComEC/Rec2 family competence protein [Synergistaceae bacterium]
MRILQRAPMLGVFIALISGLALYDKAGIFAFVFGVPLIFIGVMFCSYENDYPEQWRVFLFALVFVVLCSVRVGYEVSRPIVSQDFTITEETGTITNLRQWGRIYVAEVDTENYGKLAARLQFAEIMPGTRIKFDGVAYSFNRLGNFDEAKFWRAQGVNSWLRLYNYEELPVKFSFARLRYRISRYVSIHMPERTAAYIKAMLGERDYTLNISHRRWGTSHLLAVSGFHVGLVILCMSLIFGKDIFMLSLIMWTYILLTGCAVSALRAGLMLQVGLFARVINRPISGINTVSVAGVSLLLYSPFMFWDIGFRLSVLAAMLICSLPRKKFSVFIFSPAIWLVTFPQVSYTFRETPVVGVILNLFAPLYFSFAFIMGFISLILKTLQMLYTLAVEGVFVLFDKIANFFVAIFPDFISWNYFLAWCGAAAIIFFVCRELKFSWLRTLIIMIAGSFASFVIFL